MPRSLMRWPVFWILWLTGLALFLFIGATNSYLSTPVAPMGIIDHQSAATAARVDEIYASWSKAGVNDFAAASMLIDLLFIGIYSFGGAIGAVMILRASRHRLLRAFGFFALLSYVLFALLDYVETVSELIQQLSGRGNDTLAMLAADTQPLKMTAFLTASAATIIVLIWYRFVAPREPAAGVQLRPSGSD